jgi:hypothetical protein
MSRSKKKPVYKDRGYENDIYWRKIRRIIKMAIKKESDVLPLPKEIINDYNYSDFKFDYRFELDKEDEWVKRFSRK